MFYTEILVYGVFRNVTEQKQSNESKIDNGFWAVAKCKTEQDIGANDWPPKNFSIILQEGK